MNEELVEVKEWRKQNRPVVSRAERALRRQRRARVALVFGLACALAWHFSHLAGEKYTPTLSDVEFWLHLLIEGLVAVYSAALWFILAGLIKGEL